MPFTGHRSMIPSRSRYPMAIQQQPAQHRPLPPQRLMRAASYDPYTTRSSPQPQISQSYTPMPISQNVFHQHNTIQQTNMAYPLLPSDFDETCFSKGATPEATLNPDIWGDGVFYSMCYNLIFADDSESLQFRRWYGKGVCIRRLWPRSWVVEH